MQIVIEIRTRNVTFERWRELYHSEELSRLLLQQSNLRERSLLEHVPLPDGRERRKIRVVPNVELPKAARGLLRGREIAYTEITVYDPSTRTARLDIENEAADGLRIGGNVRYTVESDSVCMRFDGEVNVNVFGVGGLIERFIAGEVKKRYALVEKLMQELANQR